MSYAARSKMRQRSKRQAKRKAINESNGTSLKACTIKHLQRAVPLNVESFALQEISPTKPGWRAKNEAEDDRKTRTLEQLTSPAYAMDYFKWDGTTPGPLVDIPGRIFGAAAGMPRTTEWDAIQLNIADAFEAARGRCHFSEEELVHRRGPFPALDSGISFGGGQKVLSLKFIIPMELSYNALPGPMLLRKLPQK
jgi:hypothetical protein